MSGFSAVTYALAKKYTNETAIQFGGLKGAPCKVGSITKKNGKTIVNLVWENDQGQQRTTSFIVKDGTPIYTWEPNYDYNPGDLAIYQSQFYMCVTQNSDDTFDPSKWDEIGGADGNYNIVDSADNLPIRFSVEDRKMYYCMENNAFYLWNGYEWVEQTPDVISNEDIDALFN